MNYICEKYHFIFNQDPKSSPLVDQRKLNIAKQHLLP